MGGKELRRFLVKTGRKDYLEDVGVIYCVIIKCILKEEYSRAGDGFI
jgi:hypothetical protein